MTPGPGIYIYYIYAEPGRIPMNPGSPVSQITDRKLSTDVKIFLN